jgi:hypothetical protein
MKQGDTAWHYSTGPRGVIRRVAIVVGLHESGDRERVNLAVFPTSKAGLGDEVFIDAVPVRYDYKDGGPVDAPFCAPRSCGAEKWEGEAPRKLVARKVVVR